MRAAAGAVLGSARGRNSALYRDGASRAPPPFARIVTYKNLQLENFSLSQNQSDFGVLLFFRYANLVNFPNVSAMGPLHYQWSLKQAISYFWKKLTP